MVGPQPSLVKLGQAPVELRQLLLVLFYLPSKLLFLDAEPVGRRYLFVADWLNRSSLPASLPLLENRPEADQTFQASRFFLFPFQVRLAAVNLFLSGPLVGPQTLVVSILCPGRLNSLLEFLIFTEVLVEDRLPAPGFEHLVARLNQVGDQAPPLAAINRPDLLQVPLNIRTAKLIDRRQVGLPDPKDGLVKVLVDVSQQGS